MQSLNELFSNFASFAWGLHLVVLLIGGGLYFLVVSRFLPFRMFGHALQVLRGKYDNPDDPGEITHFQALTTALSATIGMGNVAGVAVAIALGGPGAIFWMWVSAFIGMATKFFTCTLAVMFRGKDSEGQLQGGPMYVIMEGLGKSWKPLAVFFSLCGMVGALPVFNANQLTQAIGSILLEPNGIEVSKTTNVIIGVLLVVLTGVVILGGLKRISKTASRLVPAMVILYFVLVFVVLIVNAEAVPYYFKLIFTDAFSAEFFNGEAFLGGTLGGLILLGIRRGAFSNEAGIGTAPMAHGAAKTNEPVREGLVAMLGPFIDTVIVCTLTALAILVTGVWQTSSENGVSLTALALGNSIPGIGQYLLLLCVAVFSLSSLFSYAYYGSKCMGFLFGAKNKHYYNYIYVLSILIGATTSLSMMINLIDGVFAFMAIPTMLSALWLSPKVMKEVKAYRKRLKEL